MGNVSQIKAFRKQLRNVVQDAYPAVLTNEVVVDIEKKLVSQIGTKLDLIAENVTKEVKKIDDQTQTFRGMLMRDASMQISQEMLNINATMLAWQNVLSKKLGLTDLEGLEKEIQAEKISLLDKLEAEAKAAEAKAKADQAAEIEEAKKSASAATEAPAAAADAPVPAVPGAVESGAASAPAEAAEASSTESTD